MIALKRKHTSGLHLRIELAGRCSGSKNTSDVWRVKSNGSRNASCRTSGQALIHDAFAQASCRSAAPGGLAPYFELMFRNSHLAPPGLCINAFTGQPRSCPMTTRLPAIQTLASSLACLPGGRCTRASPPEP